MSKFSMNNAVVVGICKLNLFFRHVVENVVLGNFCLLEETIVFVMGVGDSGSPMRGPGVY
jgi:hypothetical protein